MEITINIPTSPNVSGDQFITDAATGWGWDQDQGISAREFIMDRFEEQLYQRFTSYHKRQAEVTLAQDMPRPESRGAKVAKAREAKRRKDEEARLAAEAGGE